MSRAIEDRNRRMLRARDTMDRAFAQPLDVPALARVAHISPAHFSRQFRATFGETPHRYLQRRGDPRVVAKGAAGGGVIFETDDCRGTYERLRAAGVEFTQEPTERFYGTDCALRDPFGNPIRFTEPPNGPIVVPSAEELRAQS